MDQLNIFLDKVINFDYLWFLSNIFSMITFESFLKLLVIYFFIVWIAIIVWVTKDIINRTNNILLQIFAIFTVLLWTPLWIVIYLLIRPSKTLFEQYYEESSVEDDDILENNILSNKEVKLTCPHCDYIINTEFKFCPNCKSQLRKDCITCHKELKPFWSICPYCWTDQEKKVDAILNNK